MKLGIAVRKTEEKKPTRHYSKKQEDSVAKIIGGRKTSNSGATPFDPGDISSKKFLFECKTRTTHSESISIKKDWLQKIKQESLFIGKPYSGLIFNFGPDEPNYVILQEDVFYELLQIIENL